jgi:hypothetical protein
MTIIAIPISRRSIFRMKGPGVLFMEALFLIGLLSIKGLGSATNNFLRLT